MMEAQEEIGVKAGGGGCRGPFNIKYPQLLSGLQVYRVLLTNMGMDEPSVAWMIRDMASSFDFEEVVEVDKVLEKFKEKVGVWEKEGFKEGVGTRLEVGARSVKTVSKDEEQAKIQIDFGFAPVEEESLRQVVEQETALGPQQILEQETTPGPRHIVEQEVAPGPQQIVEPEATPGPRQIVEPETAVPGPQQIVEPETSAPGPRQIVEPETAVPGPQQIVEPETPAPPPEAEKPLKRCWRKKKTQVGTQAPAAETMVQPPGVKIDRIEVTLEPSKGLVPVTSLSYNKEVSEAFKYVKQSRQYVFRVNYIEDPGTFFMELMTERKPANKELVLDDSGNAKPVMWQDMQCFYSNKGLQELHKLKCEALVDHLYVYYDSHSFERVRVVTSEMHLRRARVLLIDWGMMQWVSWHSLYNLATFFTQPGARSFECYLTDVQHFDQSWSEAAIDRFRTLYLGKKVMGVVDTKTLQEGTEVPKLRLGVTLLLMNQDGVKIPQNLRMTAQGILIKEGLAMPLKANVHNTAAEEEEGRRARRNNM